MKKSLSFAAISAVAISAVAVTPVGTADAAANEAGVGYYDTVANKYYTIKEFSKLPTNEKRDLFLGDGLYLHTGDFVISGKDVILTPDAELDSKLIPVDEFDAADLNKIYNGSQGEDPVEAELTVESVSAINLTTIEVKFNKEVEELAKADVTVKNADNSKQYIKEVVLSEDKKSAQVVFYNALENGTYNLAVNVADTTLTSEFDFEVGKPAEIELEAQAVVANEKVAYKVLDENGVDITSEYEVEVITDNPDFFTATKGQVVVNGGQGDYAFAKFVIKEGSKVIAESPEVKITLAVEKATSVADHWTLADNNSQLLEDDYAPTTGEFKQDKTVNLGGTEYLRVSVLDQFGEDIQSGFTLKYESLDEDIAIVDEASGLVTPRKAGTVPVKVTLLESGTNKVIATKIIELTVAEKAELTTFELSKESIELVATEGVNTEELTIKGLDQFGDKFPLTADKVKIKELTDDEKKILTLSAASVESGEVSYVITGHSTGTVELEVTVGEVTKTVTVTITEAGEIVGYEAKGLKSELTYLDDEATEDVDETKMEITVNGVDEAGLPTDIIKYALTKGDAGKFFVEVKDKDGAIVDSAVTASSGETKATINVANLKAKHEANKGPFKVVVTVGTKVVAEQELTVTDNRKAPEFSIISNNIEITSTTTKTGLLELLDIEFPEGTYAAITDIEFVSKNSTIIKTVDADTAGATVIAGAKDGSTQILVDTITISTYEDEEAKSTGTVKDTFKIDLDGEVFNVKVIAVAQGEVNTALASVEDEPTVKVLKGTDATDEAKLAAVEEYVVNKVDNETVEVSVVESEEAGKYDVTLSKGGATAEKTITVTFEVTDEETLVSNEIAKVKDSYEVPALDEGEYTPATLAEAVKNAILAQDSTDKIDTDKVEISVADAVTDEDSGKITVKVTITSKTNSSVKEEKNVTVTVASAGE